MRRHRRRRPLLWLGLALILAGIVALAFVGWEYVGTNAVSRHHQRLAVAQIQRAWAGGSSSTRTSWGTAEAIVRIPRFGSGYAVPVFAGTGEGQLAAGFGHYSGTVAPGQVGNYALAAHRITHGQPLRAMPELRAGDRIVVETSDAVYTYELTTGGDDLTVDLSQTWVLAPDPVNPVPHGVEPAQAAGQRLITLTTCAELFHTSNRLVAFGVLVSTARR